MANRLVLAISGLSNAVLILGWSAILFSGFLMLIVMTPTLLWAGKDGIDTFTGKEMQKFSSPDARYEILISRRVHFPVIDPLDPTATATVSLTDTTTALVLDDESFFMYDVCDLQTPNLAWKQGYVEVGNINRQNDKGLILSLAGPQ